MKHAVYYDTETTGISAEKDRIIEIAGYKPDTGESFCEFINPGMPIPKEATAVHNITNEMVASSPPFAEVGKAFMEFCGDDAILVAHNNDAFDKRFLEEECKRNDLSIPDWDYVDTLKWSRKYRNDLPKHALQYLREVYGVEANDAHRALDDVIVLHKVFSQMIDDLPIETVLQLLSAPMNVAKMPFGKHQGKPLSDVPKDYISWLQKNGAFDKPENADLRKSLQNIGKLLPA